MKQYLVFKVLLIVAIVVILSASMGARAEDYAAGYDGYAWERMSALAERWIAAGGDPKEARTFEVGTVRFYLAGFQAGSMFDHVKTSPSRGLSKIDFEKALKTDPVFTTENYFSKFDDPHYYVREIDSFLKTYPLCRRKNIGWLPGELALVWLLPQLKPNPNFSYKDVGELCLQPDK